MKFENLIQLLTHFSCKQNCIDFLIQVRWDNHVKCAFCKHEKVYHLNGKNKRYKCAKCHKQFSAIKGTIFENSPLPLQKWFTALYLVLSHKKGISSTQLAKDITVTQKTAWFMLHRIRFALKQKALKKIEGLVQIDETFVGGKNKNRRWDKKVKYSQGRSFKDKTPVLGMLDDTGNVRAVVIPNTKAKTIKPLLYQHIEKGTTVVTDEWKAYRGIDFRYNHEIVDHKRSQYVNECGFTTNSIEGAWSHLKRMIIGIYHKVSRKHLQKYCNEFEYRYNTRKLEDGDRFTVAMSKIECRLKYKDLIAA